MEQLYQGEYKIEAVRPDGTCRTLECIPNLICDAGLDAMMTRPVSSTSWGTRLAIAVGQGNTEPSFSDESLVSQVGGMILVNSVTSSDYYVENNMGIVEVSWMGTGAQGEHAGNIAELGVYVPDFNATSVTISDSNRALLSRALVRNANGAPTTITILPDETARITYTLRIYYPQGLMRQETEDGPVDVFNGSIRLGTSVPLSPLHLHTSPGANVSRFRLSITDPDLSLVSNWPSQTRNISSVPTRVGNYVPGTFHQDISHEGTVTAANDTYKYVFAREMPFGIVPENPIIISESDTPFKLNYRVQLKRTGARMNQNYFGEYRLVKYSGDQQVDDTGWMPNLIVNSGMDWLSGNHNDVSWSVTRLRIGKNGTQPSPLDTISTFIDSVDTSSITTEDPYRTTLPRRMVTVSCSCTFPEGTLSGEYKELGAEVGGVLLSRALIANVDGTPSSLFIDETESLVMHYRISTLVPQAQRGVINGIGVTYYPVDYGTGQGMFCPLTYPGRLQERLYVSADAGPGNYLPLTNDEEVGIESITHSPYIPGVYHRTAKLITEEATADRVWRSFSVRPLSTSTPANTWVYSLDSPITQREGERMILDFDLNWMRDDGTPQ